MWQSGRKFILYRCKPPPYQRHIRLYAPSHKKSPRIFREQKSISIACGLRTKKWAAQRIAIKTLLSSRLYCRFWNCTKSCADTLADFTADREFHPAPKNHRIYFLLL
jgi:hypothetical protein